MKNDLQRNRKLARSCLKSPTLVPKLGEISAQLHTTLRIQFLDRANNNKNNTLPLGKQSCFTIARGCAEILLKNALQGRVKFHEFPRNGPPLVVVIHHGDYFSNEVFYCLSDKVVTC